MNANQLVQLAGVSYRQLDYWVRCGYVLPVGEAEPGTGNVREFSWAQVQLAACMARLVKAGFTRSGCGPDGARRQAGPDSGTGRFNGWMAGGVGVTTLEDLLAEARSIWGDEPLTLLQIVNRLSVTVGDLHRLARASDEGHHDQIWRDLAKELGNVLLSTVRWIDDLDLSVEDCLDRARVAQRAYVARLEESA